MVKIDYQNKKADLFRICNFVRRNNFERINALDQAFKQNVLVENNKNLLSNSYTLEKYLKWNGVLSEPSPQWHDVLKKIRLHTKIISECIWSENNKQLNFFVSDVVPSQH